LGFCRHKPVFAGHEVETGLNRGLNRCWQKLANPELHSSHIVILIHLSFLYLNW